MRNYPVINTFPQSELFKHIAVVLFLNEAYGAISLTEVGSPVLLCPIKGIYLKTLSDDVLIISGRRKIWGEPLEK